MNGVMKEKMVAQMKANIEAGKVEDFANAVVDLNEETLQKVEQIKAQIAEEFNDFTKNQNLPKGYRPCSKEEKTWLDSVIETAKNSTDGSVAPIDEQMPITVFDDIFQYI